MAGAVIWEDPPEGATPGGARNTKWRNVVDTLRANPKRSARVATKQNRTAAVALANRIHGGKTSEFEPAGSFSSSYAENSDGSFYVFAAYLGEPSQEESAAAKAAAAGHDDDAFDDDEPDE